jgi:hypothetical protein
MVNLVDRRARKLVRSTVGFSPLRVAFRKTGQSAFSPGAPTHLSIAVAAVGQRREPKANRDTGTSPPQVFGP